MVPIHDFGGERGQADRDVLGLPAGSRVPNALSAARDDGFARGHIRNALGRLDPDDSAQDDGVLVERGCLRWFLPAGRRDHPRDAHVCGSRVDEANELLDDLRRLASRRDSRRADDVSRHGSSHPKSRASWGTGIFPQWAGQVENVPARDVIVDDASPDLPLGVELEVSSAGDPLNGRRRSI